MDDLIVRDARSRSGLLTRHDVSDIDASNAQEAVAPIDRDAWRANIRPRLARVAKRALYAGLRSVFPDRIGL